MPPPKPRPRLAKAQKAALDWVARDPTNQAALRNLTYIDRRIRETGGRLAPAERKEGVRLAALPPPPKPSPDVRGLRDVARRENLARGARKTGGMGQAERERAIKAFTAPEKKRLKAILKELERQGFAPPESEAQAQAQVKQTLKALNASSRAAARQAAKPPPAPPPEQMPTGWAKKTTGALDWVTPERVERAFGEAERKASVVPGLGWLENPAREAKELAAGLAQAIPAIGETVYRDVTGETRWGAAKLAKEMGVGFAKDIERYTPIPASLDSYRALLRGDLREAARLGRVEEKRMREAWQKKPLTGALTVYAAAAVPARAVSVGKLAKSIAKANPEMSKAAALRAARTESYRPGYGAVQLARGKGGWKGGIPKRMLTGRLVDDEGKALSSFQAPARPPSRTPLGRALQAEYDRISARLPETNRFSELRRAARANQRKRQLGWERTRTRLIQEMAPIERYIRQSGLANKAALVSRIEENKARLAETFWAPQGPSGIDPAETLRAVADDLRQITQEGGQAIPTNALEKINKEIRRVDIQLERHGPPIHLGTGLWADAANVMRDAGYSQEQIEVNLELASAAARAWARREPGRDPNEWLGSPEGRNITGFEFGTPDAAALSQSLFQVLYPGDADIQEWAGNPSRVNRAAIREQRAEYDAAVARGEIDPEATPFTPEPPLPPPLTMGPGVSEKGGPLATHSTRHAQAAEDIAATIDADGNMLEGADPKLYKKVKEFLPRPKWRTTLAEKSARMEAFWASLDKDQQALLSAWYERTWDYIAHIYGEDVARNMGNAFYTGQAAQSPAAGIELIFKVAQRIAQGEKAPDPKEGFRTQNVWKLMTGKHLGQNPTGIAAKLMDFFDSGAGLTMRTLLESKAGFSGPGVVDRWTWRSDGYVTPETDGRPPTMMAARVKNLVADKFLATTTGKTYAYEYSSMRLQKLTDQWNAERKFERDDWRIEEIQALDWFATKQEWVHKKWTRADAEGGSPLDMAHHNTREIVFDGTPAQLEKIIRQTGGKGKFRGVRPYTGIVKDEKGKRPAWYSVDPDGKTHALVIGATRAMDLLEDNLAQSGLLASFRYPGEFGGTGAKRTAQLDIPRGRRDEVAELITRLNLKDKERPHVFNLGDSYRLSFGSGKRARENAEEMAKELGLPMEEVVNRTLRTEGTPEVLYQRNAQGIAGAVQWLDTPQGKQLLYLSEHANASTFAHELFGHAAHEMRRELPTEFAAVEKRYKKPLEEWSETEHERFAREMERYLTTGKAPTPELQPVFEAMRAWMRMVYETIQALGRPVNPETKALFDRYFGKEPLDFTPPKRLRRGLPDPKNLAEVGTLVDETATLLMHGPDVLRQDPARRLRIAGNMKWLEQQVLPFVDEMDSAVAERVHDLFTQFNEVKSGSSIFNADERRLLEARGHLLRLRHGQLRKMEDSLRAQPDQAMLDLAREVMDQADDAKTLEDVQEMLKDLRDVSGEIDRRTKGDFESQRLLERQVRDIERALDPERKVNKAERDEAILALREISEQMRGIYMEVFGEGLDPTGLEMLRRSLDVRDNLVATRLREMNLLKEGTGSGTYMPHYSIFDQFSGALRGAKRLPAAGRRRKQLSMKQRADRMTFGKGTNKLVRYGTGTLRVDPRGLLAAYKNRFRFLETAALRKQLYEIGVEIPKDPLTGNPVIPEGWYILNGTGKAVPQRLQALADMSQKEIDELLAAGEDFDSKLNTEQGTVEELQRYRDQWLRKGEVPAEWDGDKLRMLPPEVVETMVGKVFESTPGGFFQSLGGTLAVGARVATIYSHAIGYVQANVAANAFLLGLTQPAKMPRAINEFLRTPLSLRSKDPHLYERITVEAGDVLAEAGLPDFYVKEQTGMERFERTVTKGARRFAEGLGGVADRPFRVAAWTGHARKYGFTDPEGWKELLDSTHPEVAHIRDIVSQRTREDMLDFNKMTPAEQRMSRYFFIWPFIRAATAQPFWLAREYPARLALMTQASEAQERAYEEMGIGGKSVLSRYNAVAPAAERTMFDVGQVPFLGGTVNMGTVNPVGPLAEKVDEASKLLHGDPTVLGNLLNPALRTGGQQVFGGREFDWKAMVESFVPGVSYARAWQEPKKRGAQIYTDRDSFWDYIRRREGRFTPEEIDPEKVREAGKEEAEKLDKRPAWEKAHEEDLEAYDKIVAAATKKGQRPPTQAEEAAIKRSINAYNALDQAEDAMKDKTGKSELDEYDKIKATYAVAFEFYPERARSLPPLERVLTWPEKSRKEGVNDVHTLRMDIRDKIQGKRSTLMSRGRDLEVVKD